MAANVSLSLAFTRVERISGDEDKCIGKINHDILILIIYFYNQYISRYFIIMIKPRLSEISKDDGGQGDQLIIKSVRGRILKLCMKSEAAKYMRMICYKMTVIGR